MTPSFNWVRLQLTFAIATAVYLVVSQNHASLGQQQVASATLLIMVTNQHPLDADAGKALPETRILLDAVAAAPSKGSVRGRASTYSKNSLTVPTKLNYELSGSDDFKSWQNLTTGQVECSKQGTFELQIPVESRNKRFVCLLLKP